MTFDLFSVGLSNQSPTEFVALLAKAGITAIADVRSVPASRHVPWTNSVRLKRLLHRKGIAYVHLPELGARPDDPSSYRDGRLDFASRAAHPDFLSGMTRLAQGARGHRVAITCAEKHPCDCHRSALVATACETHGLKVGHLHADGSILSTSDIAVDYARRNGLSADLFAPGGVEAAVWADIERKIAFRQ